MRKFQVRGDSSSIEWELTRSLWFKCLKADKTHRIVLESDIIDILDRKNGVNDKKYQNSIVR